MKPAPFVHHAPRTVDEATSALAEVGHDGKVLAGGQSLVPMLNMRLATPGHVVDVNGVVGLDAVEVTADHVRVGALVRHADLERHDEAYAALPLLRPHWLRILLMGGLGYTAFNCLFYAAGVHTGAISLALFQGAIPVLVIVLNRLAYRVPVAPGQVLGVALTLVGAGLAATHGDFSVLTNLAFNRGDVLVFGACLLYAGYTIFLPTRP